MLKFLNIYGSYFAVICLFIAIRLPFTIMTFCSFAKGVPREIDEAAIIDGCNPLQLFFSRADANIKTGDTHQYHNKRYRHME